VSAKKPRVCPACRRPARHSPLPPDGFWQVQVLQRIGMYPYRCEACDARFFRKVPVGQGLGKGSYKPVSGAGHRRGAAAWDGFSKAGKELAPSQPRAKTLEKTPPSPPDGIPRVVAPPEATDNSLTREDFVDLIGQISRSEERKGLKVPEKQDEDA